MKLLKKLSLGIVAIGLLSACGSSGSGGGGGGDGNNPRTRPITEEGCLYGLWDKIFTPVSKNVCTRVTTASGAMLDDDRARLYVLLKSFEPATAGGETKVIRDRTIKFINHENGNEVELFNVLVALIEKSESSPEFLSTIIPDMRAMNIFGVLSTFDKFILAGENSGDSRLLLMVTQKMITDCKTVKSATVESPCDVGSLNETFSAARDQLNEGRGEAIRGGQNGSPLRCVQQTIEVGLPFSAKLKKIHASCSEGDRNAASALMNLVAKQNKAQLVDQCVNARGEFTGMECLTLIATSP